MMLVLFSRGREEPISEQPLAWNRRKIISLADNSVQSLCKERDQLFKGGVSVSTVDVECWF